MILKQAKKLIIGRARNWNFVIAGPRLTVNEAIFLVKAFGKPLIQNRYGVASDYQDRNNGRLNR